jgi:hypothetical protein
MAKQQPKNNLGHLIVTLRALKRHDQLFGESLFGAREANSQSAV